MGEWCEAEVYSCTNASKRRSRHQLRHPSRASRWIPPDRHRWPRVLFRGGWRPAWVSVRLWSNTQDAAEQLCRPSRAPCEDRRGESAKGRVVGVRGLRDPAHRVRRASQPHDSARLGVLASTLALPRLWRRPAPQPRRARGLPLQLCPTAPGVAVWARNQDASHAGRCGQRATDLEPHLHGARSLSTPLCGGRAHSRDRPVHRDWHS
jgi:hypothetical protein